MKKYCLLVIVFFILHSVNAQDQHLLASTGGYFQNNSGSISFSVGEPAVQTDMLPSFILTQGFQQPFTSTVAGFYFLSFAARLVGRETQLTWITTKDINTDHYEVQRAPDSLAFVKLLTVKNNGTDAAINTYQILDPSPFSGFDYYRLKNVETNGNYNYSPIVSVHLAPGVVMTLYPNPVSSVFHINIYDSVSKDISATLYDTRGQLVESRQLKITPGANSFQWNIATLAHGVYFMRITGLDIRSFEIIKQ